MSPLLRASLRAIIYTLATLLFIAIPTGATTVIIPSDDEMIIGARAIVKGEIEGTFSRFDPQRGMVFTYITLNVIETWKGSLPAQQVVIKLPGGVSGEFGTLIYGTPDFVRGESVLLYLDTWADGSLKVHQSFLGKFNVIEDKVQGTTTILRAGFDSGVTVLGRSPLGTITDKMPLNSYGQMIREKIQRLGNVNGHPVRAHPAGRRVRGRSGGFNPVSDNSIRYTS